MATTLDEVMELVKGMCVAYRVGDSEAVDFALSSLGEILEPIIADAQRYRSLQGKIDEQA